MIIVIMAVLHRYNVLQAEHENIDTKYQYAVKRRRGDFMKKLAQQKMNSSVNLQIRFFPNAVPQPNVNSRLSLLQSASCMPNMHIVSLFCHCPFTFRMFWVLR